ncbi:unnamed protein product [Polarella glacialis]|uniref:ILEI/PANDER domain-containing protein n=1 Tax=Polarella glacialis TaxID=89957 RepID=A0A813JBD8_POLGL|nr:unnamed protein product [Polarella glacialis]
MDEAQGNISSDAKTALKSLGATKIDTMVYRGSYALIAVKGGVALAEQTNETTISAISAQYDVNTGVSGNSSGTSFNLTVKSGAYPSELAEFYVDGVKLDVAVARGMNVAVVQSDGSLGTFTVFDTHGSDSEAMVTFINSLQRGSMVLIAAMDEAQGNISSDAKTALKSLGATKIDTMVYRGSYALIAVKGGVALAEQTNETTISAISAQYDVNTGVSGNSSGSSFDLTIKSGAYPSALAEFYVDGVKLDVAVARGMNVAVVQSDGSLGTFTVFDTHGSDSEAMVTFINSLQRGSLVLIAAMDEAQGNISSDAKTALKSLGATKIDNMVYRGSYALIAVKGGVALAEQTNETTISAISAQYDVNTGVSGNSSGTSFNLTVKSGAYPSELAEFYVDGVKLDVAVARGMNVAVVQSDGSLGTFTVFDTHGSDSEVMVTFINSLQRGSLVLIAAMDEAQGNISSDAKTALKSLGATKIDTMVYRGSYVLIAVKGGVALAEQTNETTISAISAQYDPTVVLTTTATTSTTTPVLVPLCYLFRCAIGLSLKEERWSLTGSNVEACCDNASSPTLADVGVQSAGFADGNTALFYANGKVIFTAEDRGLTVVTLRPDGTRLTSLSFDTMAAGSDDLAAYLESLENATLVLIGAKDEASTNLTAGAKAAIKSCGATQIDSLGLRGAYALVGIKGGSAQAEMVRPTGAGYALAVGHMEILVSVDESTPVCDARVAEPPTTGYLSDGNLNLDAGCRYNLWECDAASQCLQGTWVAITGSSNTLLEFASLINLLAPAEYHIDRPGEMIGASAVVDVIIENGEVTYWDSVSNGLPVCRQVNKVEAQLNDAACRQTITEFIAKAPAYSAGAIRITVFISFFWDRTGLALDVIGADAGWASGEVTVIIQVGAWYNVCAALKAAFCPRAELLAMDGTAAMHIFKDEMKEVLVKMSSFCESGGRASKRGCAVQSISWTNSHSDNANFKMMNGYIKEAMQGRESASLRFVDFFGLGGAMPEEVVWGHGSQMLNLWMWQVLLGGICPAELASQGSYAAWEGILCSGTEADYVNCPDYYSKCLDGPRCEQWECMHSEPCTLSAIDPPMAAGSSAGLCDDALNLTSHLSEDQKATGGLDACFNSQGLRRRLWCQDGMQWLLPFVFSLLALTLLTVLHLLGLATTQKQKVPGGRDDAEAAGEAASADGSRDPGTRILVQLPEPGRVPAIGRHSRSSFSRWSLGTDPCSPPCPNSEVALDIDPTDICEEASPKAEAVPAAVKVVEKSESKTFRQSSSAESAATENPNFASEAAPSTGAAASCTAVIPTKDAQTAPQFKAAGNRFPLGLARFFASCHIVVGHGYAMGVTPSIWFFGWGFTWVPWFFMLSGFVLFSSHLKNSKEESILLLRCRGAESRAPKAEESMIQYFMRRSETIYPLYAVSLIPSFIIAKYLGTLQADWGTLVAQCFLMQAWWPGWTESALQMHCWFLSCMVVYWFFFKPLAYCLKNLSLLRTCMLMAFLFFLPWLLILGPAIAQQPLDWYKDHRSLKTDTALDFGVVMLKFNPVCYVHVFVLGMLLAKLRLHLDAKAKASATPLNSWRNPWLVAIQFIAPLGYLMLFLVFSIQELQPKLWGYKLSTRSDCLEMLLQCMEQLSV